jgi:hypothetical protein
MASYRQYMALGSSTSLAQALIQLHTDYLGGHNESYRNTSAQLDLNNVIKILAEVNTRKMFTPR